MRREHRPSSPARFLGSGSSFRRRREMSAMPKGDLEVDFLRRIDPSGRLACLTRGHPLFPSHASTGRLASPDGP